MDKTSIKEIRKKAMKVFDAYSDKTKYGDMLDWFSKRGIDGVTSIKNAIEKTVDLSLLNDFLSEYWDKEKLLKEQEIIKKEKSRDVLKDKACEIVRNSGSDEFQDMVDYTLGEDYLFSNVVDAVCEMSVDELERFIEDFENRED